MRIRTIKPEFWRSDDITALSREDRLLFIGLWSYVDDNGVGIDDHRRIAADLFAFEDDQKEIREFVREGLATLSRGFLIARYEVEGRRYIHVTSWRRHQKVDRPNKPRYPEPPPDYKPPTSGDDVSREGVAKVSRESPSTFDTGRKSTERTKQTSCDELDIHPNGVERDEYEGRTPSGQGIATPSRHLRDTFATPSPSGTEEQRNRGTGEQGLKDSSAPRPKRATTAAGFDEFWTAYPRRIAKRAAQQAYAAAVKRGAEPAELLTAARRYAAATAHAEARFIPHPATWLNQGRYDDEPSSQLALASGQTQFRPSTTDQRVAQGLALAAKYEALEAQEADQ